MESTHDTDSSDGGDGRSQRRDERLTLNKEFGSFEAFVSEYVSNLSRTGAFIRSQEPLAIGTKVNLMFTVLMDGIETIEGEGEVVRVMVEPPGMGVVFTKLSRTSQAIIERLLTGRHEIS